MNLNEVIECLQKLQQEGHGLKPVWGVDPKTGARFLVTEILIDEEQEVQLS